MAAVFELTLSSLGKDWAAPSSHALTALLTARCGACAAGPGFGIAWP
jgi:hypothetical protein